MDQRGNPKEEQSDADAALTDAVRALGKPTTPDDLKARGVARLRSVNLTEMAALIEKAVNRTLIARTLGKLDDRVDSFSHATRNEFISMLQRGEKVGKSVEQQAETELDRLKVELHKRRLEEKARRARTPEPVESAVAEPTAREHEIEEQLRSLFAGWRSASVSMWKLESDVIALFQATVRTERERVKEVDHNQYTSEMDRLERRIVKLSTVLGKTERELADLAKQKNIDSGAASIWYDVGLSEEDEQFEAKTELLGALFDANVKLQTKAP